MSSYDSFWWCLFQNRYQNFREVDDFFPAFQMPLYSCGRGFLDTGCWCFFFDTGSTFFFDSRRGQIFCFHTVRGCFSSIPDRQCQNRIFTCGIVITRKNRKQKRICPILKKRNQNSYELWLTASGAQRLKRATRPFFFVHFKKLAIFVTFKCALKATFPMLLVGILRSTKCVHLGVNSGLLRIPR